MIYICIPAHNEQQTVGVVLWKLRQVFTDYPRDYQLLVADDASTDRTSDVLDPYTRVLPLTVIRSPRRLGEAGALEMLLREAVRRSEYPKRDVIVTLQADFSEEPDDLIGLIKRMEAGADVAVGNKVADTKPSRMRRFSRALAGFFTRGQKWPDGVTSPFDGYRAYRLQAVRRAMEERPGQRLIRYDGWAGAAELLRAVLPHARRVDAVDIMDRTDRLQRERREKPFDAAMRVRSMARGVTPDGLVGVEELDAIAAAHAHSRDRTTLASMRAERAAQRSGGGDGRRRDGEARGDRTRAARSGNGNGSGGGSSAAGRPERQTRGKASAGTGDGAESRGEGARRERQERKPRARADAARQAESTATGAAGTAAGAAAGASAGAETEGSTGRRSRRRRRRSESAGSQATGLEAVAPDSPELLETLSLLEPAREQESEDAGAEGEKPGRKRRRRRRKRPGSGSAEQGELGLDGGAERDVGATDGDAGNGDGAGEADGGDDGINAADGGTGERKRRRRGGRRGGRGRRRRRPEDGSPEGAGSAEREPGAAGGDGESSREPREGGSPPDGE